MRTIMPGRSRASLVGWCADMTVSGCWTDLLLPATAVHEWVRRERRGYRRRYSFAEFPPLEAGQAWAGLPGRRETAWDVMARRRAEEAGAQAQEGGAR